MKQRDISPDDLYYYYHEQGMTLVEVGKIVGLAPSNVAAHMERAGIPRRGANEAPQPWHVYDEHFFDEWSPEMAWVLGLIFADGNLSQHSLHGFHCTLSSIDIDLLEQVRWLVDTEAPVRRHKNRDIACLQISSTATTKTLMEQHGLTPAKSRCLQWPDPPDWCMSHFVRGLWDGDGCVFVRNRTRTRRGRQHTYHEITSSYVSGTRVFVYVLRDAIERFTETHASVKERQGRYKPYWVISYYHRASLRWLPWMYQDSTPLTRLARKFEKYNEFAGPG